MASGSAELRLGLVTEAGHRQAAGLRVSSLEGRGGGGSVCPIGAVFVFFLAEHGRCLAKRRDKNRRWRFELSPRADGLVSPFLWGWTMLFGGAQGLVLGYGTREVS